MCMHVRILNLSTSGRSHYSIGAPRIVRAFALGDVDGKIIVMLCVCVWVAGAEIGRWLRHVAPFPRMQRAVVARVLCALPGQRTEARWPVSRIAFAAGVSSPERTPAVRSVVAAGFCTKCWIALVWSESSTPLTVATVSSCPAPHRAAPICPLPSLSSRCTRASALSLIPLIWSPPPPPTLLAMVAVSQRLDYQRRQRR